MKRLLFCLLSVLVTACGPEARKQAVPILLFAGSGTSPGDVKAVEAILRQNQLDYSKVNSSQLNAMTEGQLRSFRLLIFPGGNFLRIAEGLTPRATTNVYNAVQAGANYLGICAGAFMAGKGPFNSVNLTGVRFGFYKEVNRGVHKAPVAIELPGRPAMEQYWEDGPDLAGWGAIVGKYPDGRPAIVQGMAGKGFVILCGVHPEAPERWRTGMNFHTPARVSHDFAATLIRAALRHEELAHY